MLKKILKKIKKSETFLKLVLSIKQEARKGGLFMVKEIEGKVISNPRIFEKCCGFIIENGGKKYLILSENEQAVKDNIFVKEGQEINIRGSDVDNICLEGIIVTETSKILLETVN